MKHRSLYRSVYCLIFINAIHTAVTEEKCQPCVAREECTLFGSMSREEQRRWVDEHPCDAPTVRASNINGFSSVAKGDYVCCPSPLQAAEDTDSKSQYELNKDPLYTRNQYPSMISYNPNDYRAPANTNWYPGSSQNVNFPGQSNSYTNPGQGFYNPNPGLKNPAMNYDNLGASQNPYMRGRNSFEATPREQCSAQLTSFPPAADSACCGHEASESDKITESQNFNQNRPSQGNFNEQIQYQVPRQSNSLYNKPLFVPLGMEKRKLAQLETRERSKRSSRDTNSNVTVTIDTRIAGGKETEFYQFPWTVYLKITFDYGDAQPSFSCGGSLISAQYVLTAGHCLYDNKGKLIRVEVLLAEYDKHSFPRDCRTTPDKGLKCIENIVVFGEDAIIHPEYNDDRLINDIGLLRLHKKVPYTEYIRPICLPFIDIDDPNYSNLPLFVAGWGRDGTVESNIKQSAIVNLVPQRECAQSGYPDLTRRHICAAGYSGEDTCKGDSGGPLMVLYRGKYFVAGIVSGKRADSPCGTSVPSLYTNVYHYLDWIRRNIWN